MSLVGSCGVFGGLRGDPQGCWVICQGVPEVLGGDPWGSGGVFLAAEPIPTPRMWGFILIIIRIEGMYIYVFSSVEKVGRQGA